MPALEGREAFARQAVEYFRRQDYREKELLIMTLQPDNFADLEDENIRVIRAEVQSETRKITQAVNLMSGEVVVRWDDDDVSFPHRISASLKEFLHNPAKVMGLVHGFILQYAPRQLFYCPPMSVDWMHPSAIFWPDHWNGRNDFRGVAFAALENITVMAIGAHPGNTARKTGWMRYRSPLEVPESWL